LKGYDTKKSTTGNSMEISRDVERQVLISQIEEGFLQAERGELIDADQARREIQAMKNNWYREPASEPSA
jgi:predicted transcriptional regulator